MHGKIGPGGIKRKEVRSLFLLAQLGGEEAGRVPPPGMAPEAEPGTGPGPGRARFLARARRGRSCGRDQPRGRAPAPSHLGLAPCCSFERRGGGALAMRLADICAVSSHIVGLGMSSLRHCWRAWPSNVLVTKCCETHGIGVSTIQASAKHRKAALGKR